MDDAPLSRSTVWTLRLIALTIITLLWLWSHRSSFGDVPESAIVVLNGEQPLPTVRPGNLLLISPLYIASLNPQTKFADWAQYTLTAGGMETDNVLSRNWRTGLREAALEDADYTGSDYDRGHLVPLASVSNSPHAWQVNRLEVIAPQTADLNRGVWLKLEDRSRALARQHGQVKVTVGTLYEAMMPPLPQADEPHHVPSHYWLRLIYDGQVECYIVPQLVPRDALPAQYALDEKLLRGRVKLLP